jgi:hypothetical protein
MIGPSTPRLTRLGEVRSGSKTAAEHDARRRRLIPSNRTPIGEPECLRDAMLVILSSKGE